jgi:starch phosphorylase
MESRIAWHYHRRVLVIALYSTTDCSTDSPDISKSIVNHVQTSLARAPYNIDEFGAYQAAALSVRDNLIVSYDLLVVSRLRLAYARKLASIMPRTQFYTLLPL